MSSRVKTSYRKKEAKEPEEKENEIDKTIPSRLRTLRERNKKVTFKYNDSISLSDNERLETENLKPLGFWSKKLKDLESNKITTKAKKYELYEFSESDDSFSPKKRRKKPNKKSGVTKKKQYGFDANIKKTSTKFNLKKKGLEVQEVCDKNFAKENFNSYKEKDKIIKKEQQVAFSSILTSTPATNKCHKIDASNFMFISPLLKPKDFQDCQQSIIDHNTPVKTNFLKTKTVKQQSNLLKPDCTRVLRSRKIID